MAGRWGAKIIISQFYSKLMRYLVNPLALVLEISSFTRIV